MSRILQLYMFRIVLSLMTWFEELTEESIGKIWKRDSMCKNKMTIVINIFLIFYFYITCIHLKFIAYKLFFLEIIIHIST